MVKLYKCNHCGNIIAMVEDKGVNPVCCGELMTQLNPNTTDGATEKHVPVVDTNGNIVTVKVGSIAHPMMEEHHIAFIILETTAGMQIKNLDHTDTPEAVFALAEGEKAVAAYEYCNLHGFWKLAL